MITNELIEKSLHIITEYYDNHLPPFFDSLSDDVLWIGPVEGQEMRGRENMINVFSSEEHNLTFTVGSVRVQCITLNKNAHEVLLHYEIYTHYPSGNTDLHNQRTQLSWHLNKSKWKIALVHVSNEWKKDDRDTIYPVHYENAGIPVRLIEKPDYYITLQACDMKVHRISIHNVIYVETIKKATKLIVHAKNENITINGKLSDFEKKYDDHLLRIHTSFLVNPSCVTKIERFNLQLQDGTILPIPEKKYTEVKEAIFSRK